jgi:hypothetical protein
MKHEAPKPLVVPAGTVITVRLGQTVGSKISSPGETFTATVASPVVVEGKTAIASGASASGTVVDAKPLGRLKINVEHIVRRLLYRQLTGLCTMYYLVDIGSPLLCHRRDVWSEAH